MTALTYTTTKSATAAQENVRARLYKAVVLAARPALLAPPRVLWSVR